MLITCRGPGYIRLLGSLTDSETLAGRFSCRRGFAGKNSVAPKGDETSVVVCLFRPFGRPPLGVAPDPREVSRRADRRRADHSSPIPEGTPATALRRWGPAGGQVNQSFWLLSDARSPTFHARVCSLVRGRRTIWRLRWMNRTTQQLIPPTTVSDNLSRLSS